MDTSLPLRPMRAVAFMAQQQERLALNSLSVGADGELVVAAPPPPIQFRFRFEGLRCAATLTSMPDGFTCRITSPVGPVPFTAQDRTARQAMLAIVRDCRDRTGALFIVDTAQTIWLIAESTVAELPTPEAVMLETALLLADARPYLRLMLEHLPPPRQGGRKRFEAHG